MEQHDGVCDNVDVRNLHAIIQSTPYLDWVIQSNTQTRVLVDDVVGKHSNVFVLHDASCGTGKDIDAFPVLEGDYFIQGYAGGIGPDNIVDVARTLNDTVGYGCYWVDMESNIPRSLQADGTADGTADGGTMDDKFHIGSCKQIVSATMALK